MKSLAHIPVAELVFFRALISLLITYLYLRWRGIPVWGENKLLLVLRGFAGTVALSFFFYTLHAMPLASAVTIQYLSPIFLVLFAGLFFGETVTWWHWLCSLVGFAGVWMIQGFDTRVSLFDACVGVVSAMASAVAYNSVRSLRHTDHEWVVIFYFPLIASFLSFPFAVREWVAPALGDWPYIVLIGVLTQIAQLFLTKAYHAESASKIASVNYVGVLYAVAFGILFFGESLPVPTIVGMILIMFSVFLSTRRRPAATTSATTE